MPVSQDPTPGTTVLCALRDEVPQTEAGQAAVAAARFFQDLLTPQSAGIKGTSHE